MKTIKERVLQIAEYKGFSKEKFFKIIGMTYGNFKGSAKKTPLNSDAVAKILTNFPEINPLWLLTGEGEMLKQGGGGTEEIEKLKQEIESLKKHIELLEDVKEKSQQLINVQSEVMLSRNEKIKQLNERIRQLESLLEECEKRKRSVS